MGIRNLTCIVSKGEYKVAKYCKWDGYPSVGGVKILNALKYLNLEHLKDNLKYIVPFSQKNYENGLLKMGFPKEDLEKPMIGIDSYKIVENYEKKHPEISRDTGGAQIMEILAKAKGPVELQYDLDFAADSLFCEWCYVIDLDAQKLEVYRGFNETPLTETDRFYFLEERAKKENKLYKTNTYYHPVRLVKSYNLDQLPEDSVFIEELDPEVEDEEGKF